MYVIVIMRYAACYVNGVCISCMRVCVCVCDMMWYSMLFSCGSVRGQIKKCKPHAIVKERDLELDRLIHTQTP